MLQIDRSLILEDVTIYLDHDPNAYNVFYPIPNQPRFRLNPDKRPAFSFFKYRFPIDHPNGTKGGGFVIFDVEFVVDEAKMGRIKQELDARVAQEANRRGVSKPSLVIGAPTFVKGSTKLMVAEANGAFVQKINNAGKPSLFGNNVATFALELTPEGATFFEQAMQGGNASVGIVYELSFHARLAPVNIKASFNATKFYTFSQTIDYQWNIWSEDSYRETVREQMIQSESMLIEPEWGGVTDAKIQQELRDWATRSLEDAVERNMIEAIAPATEDQRKVPDGIEDVTRNISSTKISSIVIQYRESQTVLWDVAPQGTLQNITQLKDADGNFLKWSDYARTIDLDDPFFRQLRVNALVNADFAKLPIHSVEIKLLYQGRPMANLAPDEPEGEVVLTDAQKVGKFAAYVENDDWKYKYSYQVNYRGQSRQYQSPEIETNESNLTIGVDDVGILAVDVSAGDLNWAEVERALVTFKYEDKANGVEPIEEQFQLTSASPSHRVEHVTFQPMRNNYTYKVRYFMKGGKEFEGAELSGRSTSLFINDVFGGRKTFSVRGVGDFTSRIQTIFVDLEYEDSKNGYTQSKSQAISSASPFFDWSFPIVSETGGVISYKATVAYKDGTSTTIQKTVATSDTLILPPATEAFLDVQMVTDLIDWEKVKLGRVSLNYADPDNRIAEAKDFIFSTTKHENATWRVELKNKELDTFSYKVTYYMADGLQKSVGPKDTEERTLVLDPSV